MHRHCGLEAGQEIFNLRKTLVLFLRAAADQRHATKSCGMAKVKKPRKVISQILCLFEPGQGRAIVIDVLANVMIISTL